MAKNNPKDPKKAPKDVRKEMDMLIKLEAATTPGGGKRSGGGRGHLPSGEEATRPGGRGRGPKSPKDLLGRQGEEATWVNQQAPGTDVLQDVELEDDASLMQAMTADTGASARNNPSPSNSNKTNTKES